MLPRKVVEIFHPGRMVCSGCRWMQHLSHSNPSFGCPFQMGWKGKILCSFLALEGPLHFHWQAQTAPP